MTSLLASLLALQLVIVALLGLHNLYREYLWTPLNLYMSFYLVVVFPGGVYLFIARNYQDISFFALLCSGVFLPLLGAWVSNIGFKFARMPHTYGSRTSPVCQKNSLRTLRHHRSKTILLPDFFEPRQIRSLFILAMVIIIVVGRVILSVFPDAPLLLLLRAGPITGIEIALARQSVILGSGKLFAILSVLIRVILPLISFFLMLAYMQERNRAKLLMFVLVFVATTLFLAVPGSKALVIFYWLSTFIFYRLIRGGYKSDHKHDHKAVRSLILLGFFGLVSILYLMAWYYSMFGNWSLVVHAWTHRMFITYPDIALYIVNTFGSRMNYFLGRTFPNPRGILPYRNINFALLVGELYKNNAITTTANTVSFVEWYANFGFMGAVSWQVWVGVILHSVYLWYMSGPPSALRTSVYSLAMVNFSLLAVTYTGSLLSYQMIVLAILYYVASHLFKGTALCSTKMGGCTSHCYQAGEARVHE